MRVTGPSGTALSRDEKARQIERLAGSSALHSSESLCRLLRYLAEHELCQPGSSVKEHQIATDVFGRPPSFDPRLDSTVRIQTSRLRSKLGEYYAHEGAGDTLIVELPNGSYSMTFRHRAPLEGQGHDASPTPEDPVLAPVRNPRRDHWVTFLVVAITLALISVAALGYILATQDDSFWAPSRAEQESPVL